MKPRTRLDRVVELRERAEDDALSRFARARAIAQEARERHARAAEAARADARRAGLVELWQLEELTHRRALQVARAAENEMLKAAQGEAAAREGYAAARQEKEIVQRAQERKRAEILLEMGRRERRDADEMATLRFNAQRS
jgi:flagellar export protein FliJ